MVIGSLTSPSHPYSSRQKWFHAVTNHSLFSLVKRVSALLPLGRHSSARMRRQAVRIVPRPRMVSHREKPHPPRREPGSTRDQATQAEQQLPVEQHNEDAPCGDGPAPAGAPLEGTDNEFSSTTNHTDGAPVRTGTLFARIAGDYIFTGSPRDLLARCRFQAALYSGRNRWQRRLVQTIRFEDAQALRRTTSIDISGGFLTRLLEPYSFDRNEIYLPVLTGMIPGPILDIDANDGSHHRLNVARRHENNEAITYQLTGMALHRETGADHSDAPTWVECLATAIYRFLSTPGRGRSALEGDINRIPAVPEKVREFIVSDSFIDEITNQRNYYTLHITYRPSRDDIGAVQDDVLKISWLEGHANPSAADHRFASTLRSIVRFFSPFPTAYVIDTPILDNSGTSGATHVRIIAPEDSTVGRVALSHAGTEIPLLSKSGSRSQSGTPSPYRTPFVLADDHTDPAVEVTYTYRQIEVLTHSNTRIQSLDSSTSTSERTPTWTISASLNPGQGRFLVPAFVNLLLSLVLIMIEHRLLRSPSLQAGESIALELRRTSAFDVLAEVTTRIKSHPSTSSFPSIILSFVTVYLAAPREHALVAHTQASGRTIAIISAIFAFLYTVLAPLCAPAGAHEEALFFIVFMLIMSALIYLACRILLIEASKTEAFRLLLNLEKTNRFENWRSTEKDDEHGSAPTISRKRRWQLKAIVVLHTLISIVTAGTLMGQCNIAVEKWYKKATSSSVDGNSAVI